VSNIEAAINIISKCSAFNITVAKYKTMNSSHWPKLTKGECINLSQCTVLSYGEVVREF